MFQRILVALDGSKHAKRAAVVATDMALHYGSRLQFISVTKPPPKRISDELKHYMEIERLTGKPGDLVSDAVQKILADAEKHARKKGVKEVRTVTESGPVARTIIKHAKRQNADVIVMGCRGLGDVEGILLGSVSHKVVSLADCAVMTVR
jgi:nucleotide-binding universal stress UspA family protein